MSELRKKIFRGLAWRGGAQITTQALALVVGVILARLLTPRAFGVVALAMVVTSLFELLQVHGLSQALVQRADLSDRHRHSVYWTNVAGSLVAAGAVIGLSDQAALFFEEPAVRPVLRTLAFQFPLLAAGSVHRSMLQRAMRFDALARVELGAALVGGGVGIGMALYGMGVWSIVGRALSGAVTGTLLAFATRVYRPRLAFDRAALGECLPFGLSLLGIRALNYVSRNLDNFLVGTYLGSRALGLYSRAYALMLMPMASLMLVLANVLFPALSSIQSDRERVGKLFLEAASVLSLLTCPAVALLVLRADSVVLVVLGEQWAGAIPLLRLLAPVAIWEPIQAIAQTVLRAQGRAGLQLKVSAAGYGVMFAALVFGLRWGVEGVAAAYLVSSLLVALPNIVLAARLVSTSILAIARRVLGVTAITTLSGGVAVFVDAALLAESGGHAVRLAVFSAILTSAHLPLLVLFRPVAFRDAYSAIGWRLPFS